MVIFVLAMVIRIVMTIASTKMTVFRWPENSLFRHRSPHGERTGKLQKAETLLTDAETAEMYIYTLSEKTLRLRGILTLAIATPVERLCLLIKCSYREQQLSLYLFILYAHARETTKRGHRVGRSGSRRREKGAGAYQSVSDWSSVPSN